MATRTAIVEGERNVLIAAPTNNTLIVTGDRNTVQMRLEGAGAALAFAFRWNRPRARKRGDRPSAPLRFERHVDRDAEVRALAAGGDLPRVANLYGLAGIGKTHVLVEAINRRECEMRDGTVYLDGRERDVEDLLHAIFEALFECRVPLRDLQIERHLDDRRAIVALEDVDVPSERAQRLTLSVPVCRVFVTSRERVLYDGVALKVDGLAPQHAIEIAEQELGRPLTGRERAAAESVAGGLRGHPLQLRQTFSRVRDAGLSIEQLAPRAVSAFERAQALSADERQVVRTLAVHGDASLGVEHIEALVGYGAASIAAALESRHEVRSHSPRYSLAAGLSDAFDERELAPELDRALEHFSSWGEDEARAGRRDAVLRETAALIALLERAQAAGRSEDVVRLGIAIEGALAWGNRWQAWQRVLELVLGAARESGDSAAEAAALHQLGTRAYGTGDIRAARHLLEQALAVREQIGDLFGAETTRQNLQVINGPAPLLYRLSHLPIAVIAIVCALLIGVAGVAGATIIAPSDDVAVLSVGVQGDGRVVSVDGSINCAEAECRVERALRSELLLRPQPQRGWEFARWTAGCSGRNTCRLLLTRDTRVVAKFKRVRDPRKVAVIVNGQGTVSSHPAGITCRAGERCQATFTRSRRLRLTAAAAPGHRFAGWSGDCDGKQQCIIDNDARRTEVHARFVADPRAVTLKVDVRGDGLGRVVSRPSGIDCGQQCAAGFGRGTGVQLSAIAPRGSRFAGWNDPACATTTRSTCAVTADRSRTVVAHFNADTPRPDSSAPGPGPSEQHETHNLTVIVSGDGTVTSDAAGIEDCAQRCSAAFPAGQWLVLTALPRTGSTFVRWNTPGCDTTCTCRQGTTCRLTLTRSMRVTARFHRDPDRPTPTHQLEVIIDGQGTVSSQPAGINTCTKRCSTAFPDGQPVVLSAKADNGSTFAGWHHPACNQDSTCKLTLNRPLRIEASFHRVPGPAPAPAPGPSPPSLTADLVVSSLGRDSVTITNRGAASVGRFEVRITNRSREYEKLLSFAGLAGNASATQKYDYQCAGVVTADADVNNQVPESDESNNETKQDFASCEQSAPPGPSLSAH
jgi:hypothetical protein